jgi:Family of unknown function (DUF5681)
MGQHTRRTPPGDHEVGYGRPPKHSQFRKGQSGNPKGRPKTPKEPRAITKRQIRADVLSSMERPVTVTIDGRPTQVPIYRAIIDQLLIKAVKGDYRSIRLVMETRQALVQEHEDAQCAMAEIVSVAERLYEADPDSLSEWEKVVISEMQRRVYDPYALD